jgi:hypothetical protein
MACSPSPNVLILPSYYYLVHEMDIDYLVVEEWLIYQIVLLHLHA